MGSRPGVPWPPRRPRLTFWPLHLPALWRGLRVLLLVLGVGLLHGLLLRTAARLLQEGRPGGALPWRLGVFWLGLLGLAALPVGPGERESSDRRRKQKPGEAPGLRSAWQNGDPYTESGDTGTGGWLLGAGVVEEEEAWGQGDGDGGVVKRVLMTAGDGMADGDRAPGAPHQWGRRDGGVTAMESAARGTPGRAWRGRCTYGGPGLLLCSLLLSRFGFLSSSVFLQCLLSFRLICLERKRQGVFLWDSR